ncbi:MAG: DUF2304 domain-containing protein [Desulfitobacteriaceae bacterium]
MSRIQIIVLLACILVMGYVLEQVRRRRMALEYSLIWIVAGLAMVILALWKNGVEYLAMVMGIYYAPSAIFVIFGIIVLTICIHFSLVISKLSFSNRVLVQRLALLENEVGKLEKKLAAAKKD